MSELYKINKQVKTFVAAMGVQIRSKPVNLKHKFILVPLVYNKATCDRDFVEIEMARANGTNPVLGQSFSKFIDYNNLILSDVKKTYPTSYKELGDPNELLAVKTLKSTCTAFGKEYSTVRYSLRDGNNPNDPRMMNDRDRQNYLVTLVKWVKNQYEGETFEAMIDLGVPDKKSCSRAPSRY